MYGERTKRVIRPEHSPPRGPLRPKFTVFSHSFHRHAKHLRYKNEKESCMSAVVPFQPENPKSSHLIELTVRAFVLAASAAGKAADAMGGAKLDMLAAISADEEEL